MIYYHRATKTKVIKEYLMTLGNVYNICEKCKWDNIMTHFERIKSICMFIMKTMLSEYFTLNCPTVILMGRF